MARPRRGNKTPATRSKFEAHIVNILEGLEVDYEYEADTIDYLPVPKWRKYTPDITLIKKDGSKMFIEIKGYLSTEMRMKHLSIHQHNPDLDIRFVFQNAKNKIYKGSKTTYSQWAEKQGFLWSDKVIPREWLKELK